MSGGSSLTVGLGGIASFGGSKSLSLSGGVGASHLSNSKQRQVNDQLITAYYCSLLIPLLMVRSNGSNEEVMEVMSK